ncbi:MAG: SWIM zinc finger family protein [Candidatus Fermentibacteraceae bacterium]|nr:SWIM zinc finger family protein [Candidatus Fermentibacteraceae bacterium]
MHSTTETGIVTEATQIARRQQKAKQDIESVTNTGTHPLFSTYEVVARSGRSYAVQIRSVEHLINSCTCPDYKTNTPGTCKHIEGVLLHLRETLGEKWEKLAATVINGGFPEEALRPVREALAWVLSSILTLTSNEEPSDKLPSPRLLQAKLVETNRLSTAQAGEVARIRELTASPDSDDNSDSALSAKTAEDMILSVEKLIDHGRELSVLTTV